MVTSRTADEVDGAREKEDMRRLEAVFFVSGRFLNMQELVSLSDLNPVIIRTFIEKLQEKYERDDSALEIIQKNEMWKMDVKREYHNIINKLATGSSEFSKAEQETLAIIAFKQPIKQSVIVKIRGNKAYEHIHNFIETGLVRSKKAGHTVDLSLTEGFFDYFHLEKKEKTTVAKKEVSEEII